MRYPRDDPGHERLATVDIETTATDPAAGELVSVGIGVHDRAEPLTEATYETFHRRGDDENGRSAGRRPTVDDEVAFVERAMAHLADADADRLVTYNGVGFDIPVVADRLDRLGASADLPAITDPPAHLDLFLDRKRRADEEGTSWPRLEACLEAYGHAPATTVWRGDPLTNARFGEELGPAYLRTLGTETGARFREQLIEVIDHYLIGDLEATLALFYADIGDAVEGRYLGTEARFD
ncbi:MAG: ribonuclease H-like domain-containing protein [Haloplanus sp.]